MSDTNETRRVIKPENGHGAGDEFGGEDVPTVDGVLPLPRDGEPGETEEEDEQAPNDDAPDDDEVLDGTILEPGYHVFEVATAIPCKQDVLLAGLSRLGIANIRLDQSRPRSAAQLPMREHRFLANVTKRLELHQPRSDAGSTGLGAAGGGAVRWLFVQPLDTDVTKDVRSFRHTLEAYDLKPSMLYESLFLSRERSHPTRQIVEEHLNEMGFMIHSLTCLQKDLRLADRGGVSVALWFGLLEWDAPESIVTEDDPFYFESLIARS